MPAASGKVDKRAYFGRRSTTLPKAAVSNRSKAAYSITSSALASSDGGTVRPNMRAVVLLMTSLELSRLHHQQVSGFRPLEYTASINTELTVAL
jgi:hypothetical protein